MNGRLPISFAYAWLLLPLVAGCGSLKSSSKYQLNDGFYKARLAHRKNVPVYVHVHNDSIQVYRAPGRQPDTTRSDGYAPVGTGTSENLRLVQASFDLDVLTIPFKERPAASGLPRQLNTNFNGALYVGYRSDSYRISYRKTPLNRHHRQLRHYGYSAGLFGGLGATAMNPSVTDSQISSEYDGVVFSRGVAAIIAVDNVTFGLGFGFDYLLDENRKFWIYQNKPWIGLTLGLNLN